MATDCFEIIRDFLQTAIKNNNGQVIIHNKSVENLCNTLHRDNFCLTDSFSRKKLENDEIRESFCRKFNWFYNQLMYIAIHNTNQR